MHLVLPVCHSERSEESSRGFAAPVRGVGSIGLFAALRVTSQGDLLVPNAKSLGNCLQTATCA
jgi:hypothetical protein